MYMAHLKMDTPPLCMSRDLNDVGGRARAVHRNALAMDLCVMTRWLLPEVSSISAPHATLHCLVGQCNSTKRACVHEFNGID